MNLLLLGLVFLAAGALELYVAWRRKLAIHTPKDVLANVVLLGGWQLTFFVTGAAFAAINMFAYEHRFVTQSPSVLTFVVLVVLDDFAFYWYHRASHTVRVCWVSHEVHHSSEDYNLGVAARQPWTSIWYSWLFWVPLPLLGFRPEWVLLAQSISVAYQYFLHTRFVGNLGPLEWILNTPSHHRVHHGTQTHYLNRNHGGIFIVWDRLFGTFAPEREAPVYGVLRRVRSHNPLTIVTLPWRDLFRDLRRARTWHARMKCTFGPPGDVSRSHAQHGEVHGHP